MGTDELIRDSIADVKDVFNKLDIDTSGFDFTGKNEAMFNQVFIKSFLNRLDVGDYGLYINMRDEFLNSRNFPF